MSICPSVSLSFLLLILLNNLSEDSQYLAEVPNKRAYLHVLFCLMVLSLMKCHFGGVIICPLILIRSLRMGVFHSCSFYF